MGKRYLGIDVGGTKSEALLTDGQGRVLAFQKGGPGNPETVGYEGFFTLLDSLISAIERDAGVERGEISAAGMGIGGYDWPFQRQIFAEKIDRLNLRGALRFENDAILGLVAGTRQGWGVCITAGTSFNCRGMTREGVEGRVVGEGMAWGEGAGGLEIAQKAIQAAAAAWTRRGAETVLSGALLIHYREGDMLRLLGKLATHQLPVEADFAPAVFECARQGDPAAQKVVEWAGEQLGSLGVGVIRQLGFEREIVEVVLTGSLFNAGEIILAPLRRKVLAVAPKAGFVRLAAPPVVGGVLLALRADGVRDARLLAQVKENLSRWGQSRPDLWEV
jgi:N-acetylglucosamine kinase-like BadF-type ATPase